MITSNRKTKLKYSDYNEHTFVQYQYCKLQSGRDAHAKTVIILFSLFSKKIVLYIYTYIMSTLPLIGKTRSEQVVFFDVRQSLVSAGSIVVAIGTISPVAKKGGV